MTVVVVGAGLAGIAAARALVAAGQTVRVLDRGHRVGGRMGARTVDGRAVDVGASYFTVPEPDPEPDPDADTHRREAGAAAAARAFADVVADWERRGVARRWTDTFATAGPGGLSGSKQGPLRWGAPGGLRSTVEDLATGLAVQNPVVVAGVRRDGDGLTVDAEPATAVVLAMPDAQALRLVTGPDGEPAAGLADVAAALTRASDPQIAVAAGWAEREWPDFAGAFVNDSEVISWIADDGSRHGDGAAVLVAHATPALSAQHLVDPDAVVDPVLTELARVLGTRTAPVWSSAKRWGLAKPTGRREQPYLISDAALGAPVVVCGDGWGGPSKVAGAFVSGHRAGGALASRLMTP